MRWLLALAAGQCQAGVAGGVPVPGLADGEEYSVPCSRLAGGEALGQATFLCHEGEVYDVSAQPCSATTGADAAVAAVLGLLAALALGVAAAWHWKKKLRWKPFLPLKIAPSLSVKCDQECQTMPCFTYEAVPSRAVPTNLVVCIDSSASVGVANFARVKEFIAALLADLGAQPGDVRVALVRFETRCELVAPLVPVCDALHALEAMPYAVGETLLGPALELARTLLLRGRDARDEGAGVFAGQLAGQAKEMRVTAHPCPLVAWANDNPWFCDAKTKHCTQRSRAVTGPGTRWRCEKCDYDVCVGCAEALRAPGGAAAASPGPARALGAGRHDSVLVVTDGQPNDRDQARVAAQALHACGAQVSVVGIGQHGASLDAYATAPQSEHVFLPRSFEALAHPLLPGLVLSAVAQVELQCERVKCTLPLDAMRRVEALDAERGQELFFAQPQRLHGSVPWRAFRPPSCRTVAFHALVDQTCGTDTELQDQGCQSEPVPGKAIECQTRPLFVAEVGAGPAEPLDLVLLVDSSASVGHAAFARVKACLSDLCGRLDGDARVGLVRFESRADVLLDLSQDPQRVQQALGDMHYVVGETHLAPALRAALSVFRNAIERPGARRAVLVVTDGDPNDALRAREAAELLRRVAQVAFVAVGSRVDAAGLAELAGSDEQVLRSHGFGDLASVPGRACQLLVRRPCVVTRAKLRSYRELGVDDVEPCASVDHDEGLEVQVGDAAPGPASTLALAAGAAPDPAPDTTLHAILHGLRSFQADADLEEGR